MPASRARTIVLGFVAALALADASIVTLALPELLVQLDTGVEGVAAVLGVYTAVLAVALVPAWWLVRALGPRAAGTAGLLLFAAASIACGAANSLGFLLAGRGVQALGAAAGLVAAFALITSGPGARLGRRIWPLAAVIGTACGPALGGALTQAFSWRAIFLVQAPIALAGAIACALAPPTRADEGTEAIGEEGAARAAHHSPTAVIALALVSAALTAVLFLLVLLLVAGWSEEPLKAAVAVSIIPAAAFAGSRVGGDAQARAAAGALLLTGGIAALAFLPEAQIRWTVIPQVAAGLGMGLALPALAGELLPERDAADAARLLAVRHAGIAIALLILAPIASHNLDSSTRTAQQRGVALVLDANLDPAKKLSLAPALLEGVQNDDPRAGLQAALDRQRSRFPGQQAATFNDVAARADSTLITAVDDAFRVPFLLTAAFALLAALLLVPRAAHRAALAGAAVTAVAVPVGYVLLHRQIAPTPVAIADPCKKRALPEAPGAAGFLQKALLVLLDRTACRAGSSREELVLALGSDSEARAYKAKYKTDPNSVGNLVADAIRGGGG